MNPFFTEQPAQVNPTGTPPLEAHTIQVSTVGAAASGGAAAASSRGGARVGGIMEKLNCLKIVRIFLRILFVIFIAGAGLSWSAVQGFMLNTYTTPEGSNTVYVPFLLCRPAGASMDVNVDTQTGESSATVNQDINTEDPLRDCVHPGFLLNLAFVAIVFSILVVCAFAVAAPFFVRKNQKEESGSRTAKFSRGVVAGIGVIGALLLFQSGWGLAAIANIVDAYYKTTLGFLNSATTVTVDGQASDANALTYVAPASTWTLYAAGFVGMIAAFLMCIEACVDMRGEKQVGKEGAEAA